MPIHPSRRHGLAAILIAYFSGVLSALSLSALLRKIREEAKISQEVPTATPAPANAEPRREESTPTVPDMPSAQPNRDHATARLICSASWAFLGRPSSRMPTRPS